MLLKSRFLIAALTAALLTACGDSGEPGREAGDASSAGPAPVVVLGIDGAEWDVIEPMIERGELPNFARLRREGAWGHLLNPGPQVSPVVWSTFATGHFGTTHGILDFVYPYTESRNKRPVDSTLRLEPAIWNVATDHDLRSTVIGYFVSHPAEPINGTIISDLSFSGAEGSHWPQELAGRSQQIRREVYADNEALRKRFMPWDYAPEQADDPGNPYHNVARMVRGRLAQRLPVEEFLKRVTYEHLDDPGELFITYFRLVDFIGHSLWFFHDSSDFENNPQPTDKQLLGGAVEESYRYMDEIIGRLLQRFDGEANILIISDHGFGSGTGIYAPRVDRRDLLTGNHRPDGLLLAHGPDIVAGRHEGMTIMEVMPTLATLLGLPVSDELPGEIFYELLTDDFIDRHPPRFVDSYNDDWQRGEAAEIDAQDQQEAMESLRGLGYVADGVELAAGSNSQGFDFWSSEPGIIAYHMTGEITYYLLRDDPAAAEAVVARLLANSPDLLNRVLSGVQRKIEFFREDIPGDYEFAPAMESFMQRNLP